MRSALRLRSALTLGHLRGAVRKVWQANVSVVAAWASGQYAEGRNPHGSLYFEGPALFSYGSHFPIAVRYEVIALGNSGRYSHTTSQHQRLVWHLTEVDVPDPLLCYGHRENVAYLEALAWDAAQAALSTRRPLWSRKTCVQRAERACQALRTYCLAFGLAHKCELRDVVGEICAWRLEPLRAALALTGAPRWR